MPKINVDFNEVPNEIPQLESGRYTLVVSEAPRLEQTKKDASKSKIVVVFKVVENPKFDGRMVFDHIGISNENGKTRLKRLALACGLNPSNGLDTEDLIGKTCLAFVQVGTYVDKESNETKDSVKIKDYIVG